MHLLYIDPGTGSMLFSIFIGLAAASYFLFRTLLIRIKFLLSGRKIKDTEKKNFVIYNEGLHYWHVFEPVIEAFERKKIPVYYLTSAKNDPFFARKYEYAAGEYIGEGNKAFARLNFLVADVCLMTTPGLDVYQLKRSKGVRHYAHILHDTGDVTCYHLFGIDWFDSVLLSGEYQAKDIRRLETLRDIPRKELPVTGSTYLDAYSERLKTIPKEAKHIFTVLVSPSWGPGTLLNTFGERLIDPLAKTGWRIIIRPHPQSRNNEKALLEKLEERYKNNGMIFWDYEPENIETLSKTDVMISDFSSIIFDFAFLFNKPILYHNAGFKIEMYDASDLDCEPWKFTALKSFGAELAGDDLGNIETLIKSCLENRGFEAARREACAAAWQCAGEAGEKAAEFLLNVQRRITKAEL